MLTSVRRSKWSQSSWNSLCPYFPILFNQPFNFCRSHNNTGCSLYASLFMLMCVISINFTKSLLHTCKIPTGGLIRNSDISPTIIKIFQHAKLHHIFQLSSRPNDVITCCKWQTNHCCFKPSSLLCFPASRALLCKLKILLPSKHTNVFANVHRDNQ